MADLRSFLIRAYQINLSFLTGRPMQVEAMLHEAPLPVEGEGLAAGESVTGNA